MTAPRREMLFTSPKLSKSSLLLSRVRLSSKEDGLEEGGGGGGGGGWMEEGVEGGQAVQLIAGQGKLQLIRRGIFERTAKRTILHGAV